MTRHLCFNLSQTRVVGLMNGSQGAERRVNGSLIRWMVFYISGKPHLLQIAFGSFNHQISQPCRSEPRGCRASVVMYCCIKTRVSPNSAPALPAPAAVRHRQRSGRLAHRHDHGEGSADRAGAAGVRRAPGAGRLQVSVAGAAGLLVCAVAGRGWPGHGAERAHVPTSLPHRQGHAPAQQTLHWRLLQEYRCPK